nr:hypothetical protein CFP56_34987 [Quercus suber]
MRPPYQRSCVSISASGKLSTCLVLITSLSNKKFSRLKAKFNTAEEAAGDFGVENAAVQSPKGVSDAKKPVPAKQGNKKRLRWCTNEFSAIGNPSDPDTGSCGEWSVVSWASHIETGRHSVCADVMTLQESQDGVRPVVVVHASGLEVGAYIDDGTYPSHRVNVHELNPTSPLSSPQPVLLLGRHIHARALTCTTHVRLNSLPIADRCAWLFYAACAECCRLIPDPVFSMDKTRYSDSDI